MKHNTDILASGCTQLTEYLESKKLRKTPERFEVFKTVCQMKGIFSIEALAEKMKCNAGFSVSRATLFNTMDLLEEAHLVVKHSISRMSMFECSVGQPPTVCTMCLKCGKLEKVKDRNIIRQLSAFHLQGFDIKQQVLYLHGICKKCANGKKRQRKAVDEPKLFVQKE